MSAANRRAPHRSRDNLRRPLNAQAAQNIAGAGFAALSIVHTPVLKAGVAIKATGTPEMIVGPSLWFVVDLLGSCRSTIELRPRTSIFIAYL